MQLNPGTSLRGGEFIIESFLGQGGFGITYVALQTGLNRKVVIKEFFMKQHCNRDSETSHISVPSLGSREEVLRFKAKFIKEAQTIAGLNHPNIIKIISVFEENNTAYYVMEYIDGASLESMTFKGKPLSETQAKLYIVQVADALKYLHANNVLHLDIKPSNILVSNDRVVLIDFGVSKHYDVNDMGQTSTSPVGISEGYAPLEQYQKDGVSKFTPATDIYSLGATLYKLITGVKPLSASELVTSQHGLDFPSSLSTGLVDAVNAAMCPVIYMRPQSVDEFIDIIEGRKGPAKQKAAEGDTVIYTAPSDIKKEPPVSPAPSRKPVEPKKRKGLKWFLIIAVLAVLGCGAWWIYSSNQENKPKEIQISQKREAKLKARIDKMFYGIVDSWVENDTETAVEYYGDYIKWSETLSIEDRCKIEDLASEWIDEHIDESKLIYDFFVWLDERLKEPGQYDGDDDLLNEIIDLHY